MTPSRREFLKGSTFVLGAAASGLIGARTVWAGGEASKKGTGCPPEVRAALSGPWPSIRTPFTQRGEIDYPALHGMLDFMIEEGKAKAIVLTWGDSLFSLLTDEEIAELTKAVCRHVNKRAFVVAADNRWWTGKEVRFAKYCTEVGVDMLMVLPPDWARSTTVDSLVDHYRAVSEHIPVMVVTGFLISRGASFGVELIGRLCKEVPGVMALKDDFCGEFIRKVGLLAHEHWALSAGGMKQNHMNMVPYGADGYLSTFITFKPEIAWRYWNAIEQHDLEAATDVIRDYDMPFFDYIDKVRGSFDAVMHGIYELVGLATRYRRPPYHSLTDEQMERLAEFLKSRGLLS